MNRSPNDRRSPLVPLPGQPAPRLIDRGIKALRTRYRHFLDISTAKGFMQVS
jgi:hypothetical protein